MNLLPRTRSDFASKSYWDSFFTKRSSSFEWYGSYQDHSELIHKYTKSSSLIVIAGCGNSTLPEELYDIGYKNIYSIDISDVVIKKMLARNKAKRPELRFQVMDVLQMDYTSGSVDVVMDKGTCDALCCDNKLETLDKMKTYFSEVERVLKVGGRYYCVTLAQKSVLQCLLDNFKEGWVVRLHTLAIEQDAQTEFGGDLPVFVMVMTKMMQVPGRDAIKIFEVVGSNNSYTRLGDLDKMFETVVSLQQFAMIKHHLKGLHPGESVSIDLWHADIAEQPRFTLHIVDISHQKSFRGQFALFLVPHGRESDWLFYDEFGLKKLAESAGYSRLVIVTLHPLQSYGTLEQIKEEISDSAIQFLQRDLGSTPKKWPVLSLGDDIGKRTIQYQGCSEFSGSFIVEDVKNDSTGDTIRRLVFLKNPVPQSEVRMLKTKASKKEKGKLVCDSQDLCFSFHVAVIGCLGLLLNPVKPTKMLVVGLGGGSLIRFIDRHIPNVQIDVYEIDKAMIDVAVRWFDFKPHKHLNVHIGNGIELIAKAAKNASKWDLIFIDVDNKDVKKGLTAPPDEFTTREFLSDLQNVTSDEGFCLVNACARNPEMRSEILKKVKSMYPLALACQLEEDLNELVLLSSGKKFVPSTPQKEEEILSRMKEVGLKNILKTLKESQVDNDTLFDKISSCMEQFVVL